MSALAGFRLMARGRRPGWRVRDAAPVEDAQSHPADGRETARRERVLWCDDVANEGFFFPGPDVLVRTWHQPRR